MKRRDLKIIVSTNGLATNSGYAVFQRDLLFRLAKDGFQIAVSSFYGIDSFPVYLDGGDLIDDRFKGVKILHYPKMIDPYGSDALVAHAKTFQAHVAITHQDVPTLNPQFLSQMRVWIPYIPIDLDPVPPMVLERLPFANRILAFSNFGKKQLEKSGFYADLIVEGTDTEIFKPSDMQEARKKLGLPLDLFFWGMIGANKENPPRKGYQEAMEAFALFHKKYPKSAIFFHTQQVSPGGFPIIPFAKHLGIANQCYFLDGYKSTFHSTSKDVAIEINACDAILHPSHTEGFGLVIIEAMACGKPVLIARSTSMSELVVEGKTGEVAEIGKKFFTNQASYSFIPSVDSIAEKMETIYTKLQGKNSYAKDTREHIVKNYDIDKQVKEQWIPYMESLQEELLPKTELTNQPQKGNINPAS